MRRVGWRAGSDGSLIGADPRYLESYTQAIQKLPLDAALRSSGAGAQFARA
jgi:hypothetical protein